MSGMSQQSLRSALRGLAPVAIPLASGLGLVFVSGIMGWNVLSAPDRVGERFRQAPLYSVWIAELAVMAAYLAAVSGPVCLRLWDRVQERWASGTGAEHVRLIGLGVAATAVFLLLAGAFSGLTGTYYAPGVTPAGHRARMVILYFVFLVGLAPVMLTILLVHDLTVAALPVIRCAENNPTQLLAAAESLVRYRRDLQDSLTISGLFVSLIPIATATLRALLLSIGTIRAGDQPITAVLLYGLFFTGLLSVFYLPTHGRLAATSRELRDQLAPIRDLATLESGLPLRQKLDAWLQTDPDWTQTLRSGVFALTPLVSGVLSSVLGMS